MERSTPNNPHLTDIFQTALASTPIQPTDEAAPGPRIVVTGNNNIVSFGGGVVIHDRAERRRS